MIALDPAHSKAYHIRGIAKQRLDDWRGVIEDLERSLELEPDQEGLVQELQDTRAELAEQEGAGAE